MPGGSAPSPLEHPLRRRKLQLAIAHGGHTQGQLAEQYGVTQPAISQFASRHAETIQAIRDDASNEFAGLALAEKHNRIAALVDLYEQSLVSTPKITNKGTVVIDPETGEFVREIDGRLAAQVIKQIAEELGQLPNRLTVAGEIGVRTNYTVAGVDPKGLT